MKKGRIAVIIIVAGVLYKFRNQIIDLFKSGKEKWNALVQEIKEEIKDENN